MRTTGGQDSLPVVADYKDGVFAAHGFGEARRTADKGQAIPPSELLGGAEAFAFAGREDDRKYGVLRHWAEYKCAAFLNLSELYKQRLVTRQATDSAI